ARAITSQTRSCDVSCAEAGIGDAPVPTGQECAGTAPVPPPPLVFVATGRYAAARRSLRVQTMPWSITVGNIAGTAIRIHVTFLLFLVWIGAAYYRQGGAGAAWEGVVFV